MNIEFSLFFSHTVNRVQSKILTSVGTPAQSQVVAELFKDVDRRLECLDQRLSAIQTVGLLDCLYDLHILTNLAHIVRPNALTSSPDSDDCDTGPTNSTKRDCSSSGTSASLAPVGSDIVDLHSTKYRIHAFRRSRFLQAISKASQFCYHYQ